MTALSNPPKSVEEFIASESSKSLLRFITCGSVDDGKSTLIGRLLYDAQLIYEDQLATLAQDSKNGNVSDDEMDFSLLLDGLSAEREQGITIDVAYRYFSTSARKFIVADTPGHEQYTRNMVTAASTADLAVLLVDARKGILTQTRRHACLVSLMGVKHIVLVINKIDLKEYSRKIFDNIDSDFREFAKPLDFSSIKSIPVSALKGDNVTSTSSQMPWYDGPVLLPYLEGIEIAAQGFNSLRFPVQWVNRPDLDFRGFSGTLRSGSIAVGDEIMVTSSLKKSRLAEIVTMDGNLNQAVTGDAVTLVLEDEIDISRGDILATPGDLPHSSDQFQAKIVWMHEEALLTGRSYQLKIATQVCNVQITDIRHVINVTTLEHLAARTIEMNEIAVCNFATSKPISFDAYSDNPATGSFILVDRLTNTTVGAGMIDFSLRRADNLSWQSFETDASMRAQMKGQTPKILWFVGLSASGKSTIVDVIDRKLIAKGVHTYILDGDNVRHGLNKDLGFTDADRVENIRRVAEVARLMADAGLVVLASFISPFIRERKLAREIAGDVDFHEVFVDTPLEICEARDPKGLYAKARAGDLANFTGISSPFEAPEDPDLSLPGADKDADELADMVIEKFKL
jgi:bifunctional enzyme CysN/CysC